MKGVVVRYDSLVYEGNTIEIRKKSEEPCQVSRKLWSEVDSIFVVVFP